MSFVLKSEFRVNKASSRNVTRTWYILRTKYASDHGFSKFSQIRERCAADTLMYDRAESLIRECMTELLLLLLILFLFSKNLATSSLT